MQPYSLLQLLNLLASKDFFLDCEDDVAAAVAASGAVNPTTGQNNVQAEVCSVLVAGLRALVPLLSAELLRSYPATCDRYFTSPSWPLWSIAIWRTWTLL